MPKLEKFVDKAGEFRFRIRAANGEIVHTSEGYVSASNRDRGIQHFKRISGELFSDESI
jgi:uncharacterized protein